jgi:hypothetical protein
MSTTRLENTGLDGLIARSSTSCMPSARACAPSIPELLCINQPELEVAAND